MRPSAFALWNLEQEARALLCRLARVKSFALQETMVPAASLSVAAQSAIERFLGRGRRALRHQVHDFLAWLASPAGRAATPAQAQRRFTLLRLQFNIVLAHFDIFSEALSQRSEVDNGVWLAGLDIVAEDALALPGIVAAPPVLCYLARGPGAAIRRAHTRMPGGRSNPVSIIRIPRERMIGSAIASSLVHEVGHQGAALLDLVPSLRAELGRALDGGTDEAAWSLWRAWISEVVADLWSVSRLGMTATTGLVGVVSLPAPFVFRIEPNDPHPSPYVRVKVSAAMGEALYPHPMWRRLVEMWEGFYDIGRLPEQRRSIFAALERTLPAFVAKLLGHHPASLGGRSLAEVLRDPQRTPERLSALFRQWQEHPRRIRRCKPTLAFAVLGQARLEGTLSPEKESELLARLLRHWAWRSTVNVSEVCAHAFQGRLRLREPAPTPALVANR